MEQGENGEEKKENCKGKVKNWKWKEGKKEKFQNEGRTFFSLFKTT